jgi:hypothetical protein
MITAVQGEEKGGFLGTSQAIVAATMTSFIDFFGARGVERSWTDSGTAAGSGDTWGAWKNGAVGSGEIALAAFAGYTGGGGAAAKGANTCGKVIWYEVGSQTIKGEVFERLAAQGLTEDKVALGKYLVKNYGWWETALKVGPLKPTLKDWVRTIPKGPTPGGYVGMMIIRGKVQQSLAPTNPPPNYPSTNK